MAGPGKRTIVPAPMRAGPTVSLLSSASLVPPDPRDAAPERWLNGVTYEPEKCGDGGTLYAGCVPSDPLPTQNKPIGPNGDIVMSDPFLVYAGDNCSTFGWEGRDYVGRARRVLEACEARLVEREFWMGTASKAAVAAGLDYSDDQYLAQQSSSTTLNAGTAASPVKTWSIILEALASCGCGSIANIHLPSKALPYLQRYNLVRRDGNKWLDGSDNVVIPGVGYPGTGPDGLAASSGTTWVYATSPVRFWRTDIEILPDSYAAAMVRDNGAWTNSIEFRAERFYLVDFDRCCHFAVPMTLGDAT